MDLQAILNDKGEKVFTVNLGSSVKDAVLIMVENKIGAVLVVDDKNKPVGMFTERDNLRVTAAGVTDLAAAKVDDHMSRELVIAEPGDKFEDALSTMTEKRVRHLPIVKDHKLVGIVSSGDVIKRVAEKHEYTIKYLKDYIMS